MAMMAFHRQNKRVVQEDDYLSVLASISKISFSESKLCKLLNATIRIRTLVFADRVEYVYDQHTGHDIRSSDGSVLTFAEAGATVNIAIKVFGDKTQDSTSRLKRRICVEVGDSLEIQTRARKQRTCPRNRV